MINGNLGIEIIILQVVNSEAFPDINLAISSPFKILAKLEKILELFNFLKSSGYRPVNKDYEIIIDMAEVS